MAEIPEIFLAIIEISKMCSSDPSINTLNEYLESIEKLPENIKLTIKNDIQGINFHDPYTVLFTNIDDRVSDIVDIDVIIEKTIIEINKNAKLIYYSDSILKSVFTLMAYYRSPDCNLVKLISTLLKINPNITYTVEKNDYDDNLLMRLMTIISDNTMFGLPQPDYVITPEFIDLLHKSNLLDPFHCRYGFCECTSLLIKMLGHNIGDNAIVPSNTIHFYLDLLEKITENPEKYSRSNLKEYMNFRAVSDLGGSEDAYEFSKRHNIDISIRQKILKLC